MSHTSFFTQSPTPLHRQYASPTTTTTTTSSRSPSPWQRQSALFGPTSSPLTSSKRRQTTDEALRSSLGYFAFLPQSDPRPPPTPSAPNTDPKAATEPAERLDAARTPEACSESDQQDRGASAHTARLEREQAEATQGEFDWVRSGGVLRDACGRRDKVRTEAVRAEIRRRDEEDGIMRTWNAYEERWRRLIRPGTGTDQHMGIRFRDIPWPQGAAADKEPGVGTVGTVEELDVESIQRFFLATLRVRTNRMTRKELVRAAWLRWHPDKLVSVLARVVPEDVGMVQEGISLVIVCLKALQGS
ncbi:hypothetical protein EYR36_003083 [Pleurotus pulmonarius]|nr:hypothetical protein EYR36_003083 [Pleurotus pulmonarius]KAF4582559.1 hypothetical protein EYR38_002686 [Pleurotus pulmonarius]